MDNYLNLDRPLVFCPGCTHERITKGIAKALETAAIKPSDAAIVTDIGCSGLIDTFFNIHAFHGVHGRALTYASGIKLARPELTVIVTMGDGGMGIGGAHFLAACRRNLDLTLIVLNNFNFGMTGGQYSATTPTEAQVSSSFLNQLEPAADLCAIAESAGATYIDRCSGLSPDFPDRLAAAVAHKGFSLIETLGICTGRYSRQNPVTPKIMENIISSQPAPGGLIDKNKRPEYGSHYRTHAESAPPLKAPPRTFAHTQKPPSGIQRRQEILILGSAGMHIVTAGDIAGHAGLHAGLKVSVKNDYNVTVLRGQCVSEIIFSPEKIYYTGIRCPSLILALSDEGVDRRKAFFKDLPANAMVIRQAGVTVPSGNFSPLEIDFKSLSIKKQDWAIAALALAAKKHHVLTPGMLQAGIKSRFGAKKADGPINIISKI